MMYLYAYLIMGAITVVAVNAFAIYCTRQYSRGRINKEAVDTIRQIGSASRNRTDSTMKTIIEVLLFLFFAWPVVWVISIPTLLTILNNSDR